MDRCRKVDALDDAIHQKVRLGVMSLLASAGEADFSSLKNTLGVSDGNMSTHLTVLEEHGYISIRREIDGRRPRTTYSPTGLGRRAFDAYVLALEAFIRPR